MKIIQINASYKPAFIYGGPTMSVSKLAEELVGEKAEVKVLTTTANGDEELVVPIGKPINVDGVKVTYFKRFTKDHTHFSPSLLIQLHRDIRNHKSQTPDDKLVVHIHAWWNLVSMLSCWIAYLHQIPVVLSPRGMLTTYTLGNRNSRLKSALHTLLGKRLLAHCNIHATSQKEKEDVLENFKVKNVNIIPNFVRLGQVNETKDTPSNTLFKIIFLSRIEQKKGLELLFEALPMLDFAWHLTIAGTGEVAYTERLKARAKSLAIGDRINWMGHISNEDKFKLLAEHQLLVLPSYNENFANVVIESLSVGTPVLLSDAVGLLDYVIKNEFGWICKLNPDDIARQITSAFDAVAQRLKITNEAPAQVKKDFNEQALVQQYVKMYRELT